MGPGVTVRTQIQSGDLGEIIRLHGIIYAQEQGFDPTFEAYVAQPMAEFVGRESTRERLWIAEWQTRLVGCVAIVQASPEEAQLRWFLVVPEARGMGLGTRLLAEALVFVKDSGYKSVFLWTVSALTPAARLYRKAGFAKVEEKPSLVWGISVLEERYQWVIPTPP